MTAATVMAEDSVESAQTPFFSICIPQFNRTDYLISACESFRLQSCTDFEVCISDDRSTDGKEGVLLDYLRGSGIVYRYSRTGRNLKYDGNLRSAIAMSRGRYALLMGNDDGLSDRDVLKRLKALLEQHQPSVALTNYTELSTGLQFSRVGQTGIIGEGPMVAASQFRNYSFVGGVILLASRARDLSTTLVDGSEMYQMFLATRMVAEGGQLLAISDYAISKDLQIEGQQVDSYRTRTKVSPCPIMKRLLPISQIPSVIALGMRPCVSDPQYRKLMFRVVTSLYLYTYPFWGIEYRRVQSWRFSLGVLLGLTPATVLRLSDFEMWRQMSLWIIYFLSCSAALLLPVRLFDVARPILYKLAKR